MKAIVRVMLNPLVLDPQGKAVAKATADLDLSAIEGVRVGKHIELSFAAGTDRAEATRQAELAADRLLANPVIETWEVELLE
jgi:phosphoribosylformylglycinamidine synthase subunit PurS